MWCCGLPLYFLDPDNKVIEARFYFWLLEHEIEVNKGDNLENCLHSYLVAFIWCLAIWLGGLWWVTLQAVVIALRARDCCAARQSNAPHNYGALAKRNISGAGNVQWRDTDTAGEMLRE
jgi:hypothetical protein